MSLKFYKKSSTTKHIHDFVTFFFKKNTWVLYIQLCNLPPNTKAKVPNYLNENNFKLHKCLVLSSGATLDCHTILDKL